jgi:hypothetical protein
MGAYPQCANDRNVFLLLIYRSFPQHKFCINFLEMPAVPILIVSLVFFLLSGVLWYVRPNPHVRLFGSLVLGIGWGRSFLCG